jgi:hypothetical protein
MLITVGMLVSDEFAPMRDPASGIDERLMLEASFASYFESKEMTDIPPGVALSFAIMAYIGPRLVMPKTQTRTQRFGNWLGQKWLKRKNAKAAKASAKQAKADKATKEAATPNTNES